MTKSWVIGSEAVCDLVVDARGVSASHCKLTYDGKFVLEDLDSTNGTYVDGVRIASPTEVTVESVITLGPEVPMPWPGSIDRLTAIPAIIPDSVLEEGESYSIGRFTDNDIVLSREMVSGHHANLVISGGKMFIEDAGSTNGTAVGVAGNLVDKIEVAENDLVFFGSFSIKVTHLLAAAKKNLRSESKPKVNVSPLIAKDSSSPKPADQTWMYGAVAFVLLLAAGGWMLFSSSDRADEPSQADSSAKRQGEDGGNAMGAPGASNQTDAAKLLATLEKNEQMSKPLTTDAANVLFLITNQNESGDLTFHTGTGWLASPQLLITSAEVIESLHAQEAGGYPVTRVIQSSSGRAFLVVDTGIDQRYLASQSGRDSGREQYGLLSDELRELQKDENANATRISELELEMASVIKNALSIKSNIACFNVGWLKLGEALVDSQPARLGSVDGVDVKKRLHLHAIPFSRLDHVFDSAAELKPHGISSVVADLMERAASGAPSRWIVAARLGADEMDYRGSPLVSLDGKVIGMFTRKMSGAVEEESDDSGDFYEAISVESIRQVLNAHGK